MPSRPATTPRRTSRRLLATAVLAVVVGLGVSVSTPAGSASAAPAAPTSSSTADAGSITASQAGLVNRSFFVTPYDLARLSFGQTDSYKLAAQICSANRSGKACVTIVSYVLRGGQGSVDWRTCNISGGYTVVFPDLFQSHCG
ncbi:hypothetical protein BFL36_02515 [Clavibacter michiganensis]|uniref:Uncharacterized protein n=1 Tax=Clavibacter michiganensis TaxID=28447 RepID=A0A251YV86_9MICO|nr:hypothetical protein [Clavibacter michiganensis]OUE28089.1 hypothetical protein BFL36_02515 [Clavibacter michiganensis]